METRLFRTLGSGWDEPLHWELAGREQGDTSPPHNAAPLRDAPALGAFPWPGFVSMHRDLQDPRRKLRLDAEEPVAAAHSPGLMHTRSWAIFSPVFPQREGLNL